MRCCIRRTTPPDSDCAHGRAPPFHVFVDDMVVFLRYILAFKAQFNIAFPPFATATVRNFERPLHTAVEVLSPPRRRW